MIGNPISRQITLLVVKSFRPPFREYLVPVDQIEETTDDRIKLKCTRGGLFKMEPFEYEEYVPAQVPHYLFWPVRPDYGDWPYVDSPAAWERVKEDSPYTAVRRQNIPEGELALRRGARVEATDGYVGQVDELLINSKDMQLTHLVLLERHIFQKREITVPISLIDHIAENTFYRKLDRQSVEALPTTPIQRWTRSVSKGSTYAPLEGD